MHQSKAQQPFDGTDLGHSIALLQQARRGDREAVNELFERYEARVLRIARIRTGAVVRRFVDSQDLVQETFLVAFRKLGEFEPQSHASLINWLARILENQIRNVAARARTQKVDAAEVSIQDLASQFGRASEALPPAGEPLPQEAVSDAELQEIYDECVASLEGNEREVITLREVAMAPWNLIATELGRPTENAARELYRRARVKLAEALRKRVRG